MHLINIREGNRLSGKLSFPCSIKALAHYEFKYSIFSHKFRCENVLIDVDITPNAYKDCSYAKLVKKLVQLWEVVAVFMDDFWCLLQVQCCGVRKPIYIAH